MKPNLHRCRLGKRIATTRTVGASVPARPPEWRRSAVDVRYVVLNDQVWLAQTNKVYADGKGPKYDYTPDGRLAQRIWARGIVTDYSYDGWGSLTNTVYSDGTPTLTLLYDAMGRQTNAVDAAGVTSFAYDDYGSLTNETVVGAAGENTIIRHWDAYGRTAGYTLNNVRQTTIGYDPATGRIATMLANGSNVPFTWSYLPGSDLKSSLAYPNGLTASWTYDADDQLLQVRNATPTDVISQYDYTYDAAGRRIEIARSGTAMSESRTDAYGYNVRNELTSATKTGGPQSPAAEYAYQYDDIGNRITSTDLTTNRTYTANSLNQYTLISNLCDSASLREEFVPQFDDDGNQTLIQTSTGVWSVQYNGENRPVLWTCGATSIMMKYDRMGRRVEYLETVDGGAAVSTSRRHRFVYDGYLCVQRLDASAGNAVDLVFVWDAFEKVATRPLMIEKPGMYKLHVTHDGNKNVSELVFFSGGSGIAAHYEYVPFGAVTVSTRDTSVTDYDFRTYNPFRFSSEYADDTLGLVYYNYRHYDGSSGRWLARDPIGESVLPNIYGMCFNQTSFFFDVLGLKVYWSARDLDSFFLGNHHFITFAYDGPEKAPAELRSRLIKVTCKNCKTQYVMFMGLARLPPVTEKVERSFLGIKWQTNKKKYNIGVYQLDAKNFQSSNHKNDLQAYKEYFCKERGFWSDFDYDSHEVTGYSDENEFVSKLLKLYKRSEKNLKDKPVEYALRNRNCATWVNCILKEAGISDDDRAKINDFYGIDWGEGQATLEEWFK